VSLAAATFGTAVADQIVQGHEVEAFSQAAIAAVASATANESSMLAPSRSLPLPLPQATTVAQPAAMSVVRIVHLMNLFILIFVAKRIETAGSLSGAAFGVVEGRKRNRELRRMALNCLQRRLRGHRFDRERESD